MRHPMFRPYRCKTCGHRMRLDGDYCDQCGALKHPDQSLAIWLAWLLAGAGMLFAAFVAVWVVAKVFM
ncbi:hypothetical protein SAMN04490244_101251 [Tranquillimonas rosea]|uniref:Zinc-ribbon domain-containing protein n=1 Tax=Tranquillimonas rosea TaxID=641238 RepID=A0A1H9PMI5_9RHOB|nr:hypothetical protein [Tranquillimonas rosea]SER49300.1 hypothetical protein SAMN04490244_101251 [Tranquillimonas rosea]